MSTSPTAISSTPLDLQLFPVNLRRHVDPKAPFPLRDMGAKGIVPGIEPQDLVTILFQLSFDPEVQANAAKTFQELPDALAHAAASAPMPAPVLDWCARAWLGKRDRVERLLRNNATEDATVAWVASVCDDHLAEVVSENQGRLMRSPVIIEQLYMNPKAHQSTLDRVLEFAKRQKISFAGLPGLQAAMDENLLDAKKNDKNKALDDKMLSKIFSTSVEQAKREESEGTTIEQIEQQLEEFAQLLGEAEKDAKGDVNELTKDKTGDAKTDAKRSSNRQAALQAMNISEKVRLATIGSKEDRAILIRDPNRMVHMAALLSPKTQPGDMKDFASNKNLSDTVINYIAGQRDAVSDYTTLRALCNNPKLSLRTGLRLVVFLRTNDLKILGKSRGVSPQLAKAAKELGEKRQSGGR